MSGPDERQKILIVDDNKQNIELLMELFKDEFKIAAARDGERALKLAHADPKPDIILLDIIMPDIDGYEICAQLKGDEETKSIPVIFVTAVSEVMDATRGFALGAVDYITKPFHPPMVKARVKVHLDLKRKQELLEEYAFLDALTEIPNRRRFDEVLDKEWNRALRSGRPISVILLDIDHFKYYNDTYGHGEGDGCLKKVASALRNSLRRAGDFVARYGGEEFCVILPETSLEEARGVAAKLLEAVDELTLEHSTSPVAEHLTISLGVATAQPTAGTPMEDGPVKIMEAADKAMYQAKHGGRHRVESVEM